MELNFLDALPHRFTDVARDMAGNRAANNAVSAAAKSKKKRKGRKGKGDVNRRCKEQAADFETLTELGCGDDVECLERGATCAASLAICDFGAFFQCVVAQNT